MTGKEIAYQIADKGSVTKEIFHTIYYTLTIEPIHEMWDNVFIATLSYNTTILFLYDILQNPKYYTSEIYEIKEEDIDIIRSDYENMIHIDYPDDYCDIDTDSLELEIEENFVFCRENEERMEEYYEKNI